MVKIKEKLTGNITEFVDLNTALLALPGLDPDGDKIGQPLLKPGTSRRSFKQAHDLLERNGYSLHRDGVQTAIEGAVMVPSGADGATIPNTADPAWTDHKTADKVVTEMLKKSIKVQKVKNGDVEITSSAATPELAAIHQMLEALNLLVKPKAEQPVIDLEAIEKLIDERVAKVIDDRIDGIIRQIKATASVTIIYERS